MTSKMITDLQGVKHPVECAVITQIERNAVNLYVKRLYRNIRKKSEYKENQHYFLMVQILIESLQTTK